jgi:hypothetical protein
MMKPISTRNKITAASSQGIMSSSLKTARLFSVAYYYTVHALNSFIRSIKTRMSMLCLNVEAISETIRRIGEKNEVSHRSHILHGVFLNSSKQQSYDLRLQDSPRFLGLFSHEP